MKEFIEQIKKEVETVIAIDFDGVVHDNYKGFHDGTVYGPPIEGTEPSLKYLSEKYKLIIFTCKAKPDRPLVNGKTGTKMIWEWLKKHKLDIYISEVTHIKPRAKYYIDDKAIRFTKWESISLWRDLV